jgi:hypothetical protein
MKNLITLLDKVTLNHKGLDYTFPRRNGAVEIPATELGDIPESVALLLVLLSGAKRIFLEKETYFALREGVWFHLDLNSGGLKESAKELFEDDEDVLEAAELHRKSFVKKPAKAKAKEDQG